MTDDVRFALFMLLLLCITLVVLHYMLVLRIHRLTRRMAEIESRAAKDAAALARKWVEHDVELAALNRRTTNLDGIEP